MSLVFSAEFLAKASPQVGAPRQVSHFANRLANRPLAGLVQGPNSWILGVVLPHPVGKKFLRFCLV